jgi:hypothetical protein
MRVMFDLFRKWRASAKDRRAHQHWAYQRERPGIPALSLSELLNQYDADIKRLVQFVGCDRDEYQQLLAPAIEAYAGYVHLLPASESHHHRETGGLLRHGIETAASAGARANRTIFVHYRHSTPQQRREEEPRWRIAATIAALFHDAAKAASDMIVVAAEGPVEGERWNPFAEDLYTWLERRGVTRYHIHWQSDRNGRHGRLSAMLLSRIPPATQAYLADQGPHIPEALAEVFSDASSQTNPLPGIISAADSASVDADLRGRTDPEAADGAGREPLENTIMRVACELARDKWSSNVNGARLFRLDADGIYLVWPAAGEDIINKARKLGLPGIPSDARTISEILTSRNKAQPWREDSPVWPIVPAGVNLLDGATLWALRFTPAERLGEPPPIQEGVAGHAALAEPEERAEVEQVTEGDDDPPVSATEADTLAPPNPADARSPTGETDATAPAPGDSHATAPAPPEAGAIKPQQTGDPEPENEIADKGPGDAGVSLEAMGLIGDVLSSIRDDLATDGACQWGKHATIDDKGHVVLRHPDALKGYGEGTRDILRELTRLDACLSDPNQAQRIIQSAGGFDKAIVLAPGISASIRHPEKVPPDPSSADDRKPQQPSRANASHQANDEPGRAGSSDSASPSHASEHFGSDEALRQVLQFLPLDINIHDIDDDYISTPLTQTLTRLYHETGRSKDDLKRLVEQATQVETKRQKNRLVFPRKWLPNNRSKQ